jgi:hypothetical protein
VLTDSIFLLGKQAEMKGYFYDERNFQFWHNFFIFCYVFNFFEAYEPPKKRRNLAGVGRWLFDN